MSDVTLAELQSELREVKRRLELAEAKIAQQAGHFEFVSGQLRDIQLYVHARFADMDAQFDRVDARFDGVDSRFDQMDARFDSLEQNLDALPRVLAEMLAARS